MNQPMGLIRLLESLKTREHVWSIVEESQTLCVGLVALKIDRLTFLGMFTAVLPVTANRRTVDSKQLETT